MIDSITPEDGCQHEGTVSFFPDLTSHTLHEPKEVYALDNKALFVSWGGGVKEECAWFVC